MQKFVDMITCAMWPRGTRNWFRKHPKLTVFLTILGIVENVGFFALLHEATRKRPATNEERCGLAC